MPRKLREIKPGPLSEFLRHWREGANKGIFTPLTDEDIEMFLEMVEENKRKGKPESKESTSGGENKG